jgi:hypothetical protein
MWGHILLEVWRRFGGTHASTFTVIKWTEQATVPWSLGRLHSFIFNREDGGSTFLQNVRKIIAAYTGHIMEDELYIL